MSGLTANGIQFDCQRASYNKFQEVLHGFLQLRPLCLDDKEVAQLSTYSFAVFHADDGGRFFS